MSYFDLCKSKDVISLIKPLLAQAGFKLRDADGKIYTETSLAWETPWHHVYHAGHLDCHLWHKVIFDFVFKALKEKWVPINCQSCFKVVVRPRTLKELFALLNLQKRLGRPAKCGKEIRDSVHGLYGGYFYNWGLEAGLECFKAIRKEVDKDPMLGTDIPIILKRACTEFELLAGPSDKWEVTPEQERVEALINNTFVRDIKIRTQPDHALATVHRGWIEWAYACGDKTYLEFTNGEPLYPSFVTYHHLAEEKKVKKKGGKK